MLESTPCIGQKKKVKFHNLKMNVLIHKTNLDILICVPIACKHSPFLSACTSRYFQTLIVLQHAKPHNLSHNDPPTPPPKKQKKTAPKSKLCCDFYYSERYCRQIDVVLIIKVCQHSLACRYQRHFPAASTSCLC